MPSVVYREAESSDIPAMARIREATGGSEEFWANRISGYLNGTHNPQKALPPRVIFVAQQDDSIIGFIAGHLTEHHGCDGELEWINIIPEQRGKGAASELFLRLVRWFVERNVSRVCVDCAPDNAAALRFYKRHGAEPLNEYFLVWNNIRATLSQLSAKEQP
jgi:ribosomal protein S18 acetylase RimI-like enzyme